MGNQLTTEVKAVLSRFWQECAAMGNVLTTAVEIKLCQLWQSYIVPVMDRLRAMTSQLTSAAKARLRRLWQNYVAVLNRLLIKLGYKSTATVSDRSEAEMRRLLVTAVEGLMVLEAECDPATQRSRDAGVELRAAPTEPAQPDVEFVLIEAEDTGAAHANGQYLTEADSRGEVEEWLSSLLPRLKEADAVRYSTLLIEDGFDCSERLNDVSEQDLHFMKVGHRKALMKAIGNSLVGVA